MMALETQASEIHAAIFTESRLPSRANVWTTERAMSRETRVCVSPPRTPARGRWDRALARQPCICEVVSMILAGDIGGTSARLGLFEPRDGHPSCVNEKTYHSRQYRGLDEIAAAYVAEQKARIDRACFGIAGPVQQGRVITPNLPWVVDGQELARELALPSVRLINDLEANAYGIAALEPGDFVTLNGGTPGATGNCAVISVGTGLGEAGLFCLRRRPRRFLAAR
jgi:glucokinase